MTLLLKNLLFTVLGPGSVAGLIPWRLSGGFTPDSTLSLAVACPFFLVGVAIYAWCLWDFAVFGRGTPAPVDAPKKLVVRGLYRYTRNPMYVGVLTILAGWTLWSFDQVLLLYATVVGLAFHSFVVLYEERRLRQAFGSEYLEYCRRVPRWLPGPR